MPGFVMAQPPRKEDRSHAQPRAGLLGPSMASMARTGLEWPRSLRGARRAGLNRHDLARHYTRRSAGARCGGTVQQRLACFAVRIAMSEARRMQSDPLG